jgi:hypothetical protein
MSWVDEAYVVFRNLHSDNTPENIKKNRDIMLPYIKMAQSEIDGGSKDTFLFQLIEWAEYFDTGKVSKEKIDDLPHKLKDSMADKIAKLK